MDQNIWLSEEELSAWRDFLVASQLIEHAIDNHLREFGFSHSEYEILAHLSQHKEHQIRMGTLAKALVINKSALTYKISILEKQGLVSRSPCADDARGQEVSITDQGIEFMEKLAPAHVKKVRQVFINLLDTNDLRSIKALSQKLLKQFENSPGCKAARELETDAVTSSDKERIKNPESESHP